MSYDLFAHNYKILQNTPCSSLATFFNGATYGNLHFPSSPTYASVWDLDSGEQDITPDAGTDWDTGNSLAPVAESTVRECHSSVSSFVLRSSAEQLSLVNPGGDGTFIPGGDGTRTYYFHGATIIKNLRLVDDVLHTTRIPSGDIFTPYPVAGFQQNPGVNYQGSPCGGATRLVLDNGNSRYRIEHLASVVAGVPSFSGGATAYVPSAWFAYPDDYSTDADAWLCITHDLEFSMGSDSGRLVCLYNKFETNVHFYNETTELIEKHTHNTDGLGDGGFQVFSSSTTIEDNWGFHDKTFTGFSGATQWFDTNTFGGVARIALVHTSTSAIDGAALLAAWRGNYPGGAP